MLKMQRKDWCGLESKPSWSGSSMVDVRLALRCYGYSSVISSYARSSLWGPRRFHCLLPIWLPSTHLGVIAFTLLSLSHCKFPFDLEVPLGFTISLQRDRRTRSMWRLRIMCFKPHQNHCQFSSRQYQSSVSLLITRCSLFSLQEDLWPLDHCFKHELKACLV